MIFNCNTLAACTIYTGLRYEAEIVMKVDVTIATEVYSGKKRVKDIDQLTTLYMYTECVYNGILLE